MVFYSILHRGLSFSNLPGKKFSLVPTPAPHTESLGMKERPADELPIRLVVITIFLASFSSSVHSSCVRFSAGYRYDIISKTHKFM